MTWMILMKILKNTIQITIYWSFSMMLLLICLVITKLNPIVTELFITGRKLNISVVFITQSYFAVTKNIRLSSTHYFIMKIPNKWELQQIAYNQSSDIDSKEFMKFYKTCTTKPYLFSDWCYSCIR